MEIMLSKSLVGILIIGVVISATSAGYYHDQSIKTIYRSFEPEVAQYQDQIVSKDAQIGQLQGQIANLQSALVDGWFVFSPDRCSYYCYVRGGYSNHGTVDARNIVLTFTWKNNGAFVQINTVTLGNLAGRTTALYPVDSTEQYFGLAAPANQLSWSFAWS